jgi:predicted enzyme related to lactoylglutathione lyase
MRNSRPGAVIFTGDKERLTSFYQAMTDLPIRVSDATVTVLASDHFELVIHALAGEAPGQASAAREDVYLKPFFPVASLTEARKKAESLGGKLRPADEEWQARGFRASEAVDPDGNVIQFRQDAP